MAGNTNLHALLWDNGRITDANTLLPTGSDWMLEAASAINDAAQIACYDMIHGATRAFLLSC
jgi:hypothetical protein